MDGYIAFEVTLVRWYDLFHFVLYVDMPIKFDVV